MSISVPFLFFLNSVFEGGTLTPVAFGSRVLFDFLIFSRAGKMLKDEGYKLIGAAFEVYNQLGYGMAEEVYHQSLEIELELRGIPYRSKPELAVHYKGRELKAKYKPDLLVFDAIVVELKAVSELISDHESQLFNYMRILHQPVGYLVNFGVKRELQWKRYLLSDLHNPMNSEERRDLEH